MPYEPSHDLKLDRSLDESARQDFVAALRGFVLHDMAADMRAAYEQRVKPAAERVWGHEPRDSGEVHKALRDDLAFKFYSSVRVNAQEMVWDSVREIVERSRSSLGEQVRKPRGNTLGSLTLDPAVPMPRSVSAVDVHLMPGNYHSEYGADDATQGAFYDNGTAVFYMGLMGRDQGDIAHTLSRWVRARYPDLDVRRILDVGCTIGHNTVPWAQSFPEAEVHGVDVAAPMLRYGHARARAMNVAVHFRQMDATALQYPDDSFDVVWSSMFLHELPLKSICQALAECRRVLRPGGLMIHMELPPNNALQPYDAFYLDWDGWYNCEPFYKTFRDQDPKALCAGAGFDPATFEQHVVPSLNWFGEEGFQRALDRAGGIDKDTGRFDQGLSWYAFSARK
ncbi:MAG: class I SAM-dependent methyltransferase [Gammaproteobacteria bacterium]|nr:class I SAM-dependent methyltransferase [Gammaproteobacteria bacterium]